MNFDFDLLRIVILFSLFQNLRALILIHITKNEYILV